VTTSTDRPNLILILTDHWRGDCLGRLGHPVAETPHLDDLSRQGVTFTRAYSPCPSCVAARRSLWTGMRPRTHGVVGYQDGVPWEFEHTLAGELQRAGYQTISVGKTHFHPPRKHLGFEQLYLQEDYDEWLERQGSAFGTKVVHAVPGNSWLARPHHLPEALTRECWCVDTMLERLRKRDSTRPYFACLSFDGPHPPWTPPQVFYDQFIGRSMPLPVVGQWAEHHAEQAGHPLDVNAWRGKLPDHLIHRARAAYFAYLAFLDAQIGRFLQSLRRELPGAMVIMSSDHGEMLGDHHLWRKTYAYEASARVPFILKPPAEMQCQRNSEVDRLVGWEDIMPSFLDAAGVDIPRTVEGRSILPLLRGQSRDWRSYYHGEHSPCYHPENANQYLTDGQWKYIWNTTTGQEQLFALHNDPMEVHDLAAEPSHHQTLHAWRQRLVQELADREEALSDGKQLTPKLIPAVRGEESVLHQG
jgi:arylsulfatase